MFHIISTNSVPFRINGLSEMPHATVQIEKKDQTIETLVEFFIDKFDDNPPVVSKWFAGRETEWDAKGFYGNLCYLHDRYNAVSSSGVCLGSEMSSDDIHLLADFFVDAWEDGKARSWLAEHGLSQGMYAYAFYLEVRALARRHSLSP